MMRPFRLLSPTSAGLVPDALSTRPEYSIRRANQGTWDAAAGMNSLLHTLTVS
ncbi:MAG TPA: hypothetical protein VIH10_22445 [Kribbella sp.]